MDPATHPIFNKVQGLIDIFPNKLFLPSRLESDQSSSLHLGCIFKISIHKFCDVIILKKFQTKDQSMYCI
jgi:hypothetical protein